MDDDGLLEVLHAAATAVADALAGLTDWGLGRDPRRVSTDPISWPTTPRWPCSRRPDSACCPRSPAPTTRTGRSSWCSIRWTGRPTRRGASLVRDEPLRGGRGGTEGVGRRQPGESGSGTRRCAAAGPGRTVDRSGPSGCERLDEAIVGFSGYPPRYLGWSQYRALGAAALDLCAVAEGSLDGYAAVGGSRLG